MNRQITIQLLQQLERLNKLIALNDSKIKEKQNQNIFLKNHWT